MKRENDIEMNGVYILKDGEVTWMKPPESGYGQHVIVWVNGKVSHTQVTCTVKYK